MLEQAIKDLADAVRENTAALNQMINVDVQMDENGDPQQRVSKAEKPAKSEPTDISTAKKSKVKKSKPEAVEETSGSGDEPVTLNSLKKLIGTPSGDFMNQLIELLQRFGVRKVPELAENQYQDFYDAVVALKSENNEAA